VTRQPGSIHLRFFLCLTFILLGFSSGAFAQDGSGGGNISQLHLFIGKALPSGIDNVEEIFSLGGLRYSMNLGSDPHSFAEFGGVGGNSSGVKWQNAFASVRMDVPIETLIALAYVGIDYTRYEPETEKAKQAFGGHVGGGLMSLIGGESYVRFDMKLNSGPGTSLFFSLGLMFQFGATGTP
jgi:hypothetical protein